MLPMGTFKAPGDGRVVLLTQNSSKFPYLPAVSLKFSPLISQRQEQ